MRSQLLLALLLSFAPRLPAFGQETPAAAAAATVPAEPAAVAAEDATADEPDPVIQADDDLATLRQKAETKLKLLIARRKKQIWTLDCQCGKLARPPATKPIAVPNGIGATDRQKARYETAVRKQAERDTTRRKELDDTRAKLKQLREGQDELYRDLDTLENLDADQINAVLDKYGLARPKARK